MIWAATGVIAGLIALQTTLILYIITGLKDDMNRRFGEVISRIERLESHLFRDPAE